MKRKKEKPSSGPDPERSARVKASWTPERRAAFSALQREKPNGGGKPKKQKGGEEATVLGVLTVLRHAASAVLADMRTGEITARTVVRKDVLLLLAYVDLRDSK